MRPCRTRFRAAELAEGCGGEKMGRVEMRQAGMLDVHDGVLVALLMIMQPGKAEIIPAWIQRIELLRAA